MSHFKPLIGPLNLDITTSDKQTSLNQDCYGYQGNLPRGLNLVEMVFFTQLSRLATRDNICPVSIVLTEFPEQIAPSEEYFGRLLQLGEKPKITFSAEDANKPFITQNAAMWAFFENKFNQKLIDLDCVANTVARVRATLLESLPGGESSIEFVANKLAMSKRTLQRKLTSEAETYQSVLQSVRMELADHYLERSEMS